MFNKTFKLLIVLAITIMIYPHIVLAEDENNDVMNEILKNPNISTDTKEWYSWFNTLDYCEQITVNYRPAELSSYNYEKTPTSESCEIVNESSIFAIDPVDPGGSVLPVSGYELAYNPSYWNSNANRANCYTYALNFLATTNKVSQQPGYASGQFFSSLTENSIIQAVNRDIPYLSSVTNFRNAGENEQPGYREYKVALVIAPGTDYHWYRQNPDGSWSHKRGSTSISKTDASGQTIYNPKYANRNYPSLNYSQFVGFYFVRY